MQVASNIFSSPENTGPGNFGRRLAAALSSIGVQLLPTHQCGSADVFLGSAFLDGAPGGIPTVLRVDGKGAGGDIPRVEAAHKAADVVIYQSKYSKQLLQNAHDYSPNKSYVIHNGVTIPPKPNLKKSGANFISICNTWNQTRYINFLHAIYCNLSSIVSCIPNFRWTIVGKYEDFKFSMGLMSSTHQDLADEHIEFVEFTPHLEELRNRAIGCIHIVQDDSCPNSVIESLAVGLPCAVWRESAGPELIQESYAGVVLNKCEADHVVANLVRLTVNSEFYAERAREVAETSLDINVIAQKYAEVFHDAVS